MVRFGIGFDFQVTGVRGPESGWLWELRQNVETRVLSDNLMVEGLAREITEQASMPDSPEVNGQLWSALSHYFASEEGKTLVASVELLGALGVLSAALIR